VLHHRRGREADLRAWENQSRRLRNASHATRLRTPPPTTRPTASASATMTREYLRASRVRD